MNPILALIIANIIWGGASPIFKFSLENIPPFTLAFIRFFFASFFFLPFVFKYRHQINMRSVLEMSLTSFFGITLNISAFFLGLKRTESINAPIIASAGPVFLFIMSVAFLKEKANKQLFGGMLIALLGVMVIILSPIFLEGNGYVTGEVIGNLLFLLATFGSVFHIIINKHVLRQVHPILLTYFGFLFGAITFFPLMLVELQKWSFQSLNFNGWVGIVYGVLFSSALAYYLFNYAMAKVNAQEVGIFTYIDPIAAVILAIPLVNEFPNVYFIIGSVLIFGGIYLAEKRVSWHPFHKMERAKFDTIKR